MVKKASSIKKEPTPKKEGVPCVATYNWRPSPSDHVKAMVIPLVRKGEKYYTSDGKLYRPNGAETFKDLD